jgi:hypothetical protein
MTVSTTVWFVTVVCETVSFETVWLTNGGAGDGLDLLTEPPVFPGKLIVPDIVPVILSGLVPPDVELLEVLFLLEVLVSLDGLVDRLVVVGKVENFTPVSWGNSNGVFKVQSD